MFLIQSTANKPWAADCIIASNERLEHLAAKLAFMQGEKVYCIRIVTSNSKASEYHNNESFARERIMKILIAFGENPEEAKTISKVITFIPDND